MVLGAGPYKGEHSHVGAREAPKGIEAQTGILHQYRPLHLRHKEIQPWDLLPATVPAAALNSQAIQAGARPTAGWNLQQQDIEVRPPAIRISPWLISYIHFRDRDTKALAGCKARSRHSKRKGGIHSQAAWPFRKCSFSVPQRQVSTEMDGCGEIWGLECMYLKVRENYVCKWWSGEILYSQGWERQYSRANMN